MSTTTTLNGVPLDQLTETIEAIDSNAEIANFRFRAENSWIDGGHGRSRIDSFFGALEEQESGSRPFVLEVDEPQVLLGEDNGPNPVEYVLHALAGCLTTTLVYHAAARGIEIHSVRSSLEGDLDLHGFLGLDEDVRNGYESIRVSFEIESDAPRETLEELCQLAQDRSPVYDVVTSPVPVTVELAD